MTKVVVLPGDTGGCGSYRCIWPAEHLAALGHDVTWLNPTQQEIVYHVRKTREYGYTDAKLASMPECDVLVIQRPMHWYWKYLIPQMQQRGVKVVGEIDDDYWNVHPHNSGYAHINPSLSPEHNWAHLEAALLACDRITVTTPPLAMRFKRPGVSMVRNYIPASMVVEERYHSGEREDVTVGWAGDTETHIGDLASLDGVIGELQRKLGFRFMLLGRHLNRVKRDLGLRRPPAHVEWVEIDQYPEALSAFDIGIAPLANTAFNRAKSWLKPLEYMARGIPCIASHLPEYIELVVSQQAPYALTPEGSKDWDYYLRALVLHPDLRTEWAAKGIAVAKAMTIEGHIDQWADAWYLA